MPNRVLPILSASALVLGLVVAPAAISSAEPLPTTTVTIQLTTPKHVASSAFDSTASIEISGDDYSSYAQATVDGDDGDEYAGPITHGQVVFTDVPENSSYDVSVIGGPDFGYGYVGVDVATTAVSKSIVIAKLATISGKLTGPHGAAIHNAQVNAIGSAGFSAGLTDSQGRYTIHGLTTGTYRVQFNAHSSGDSAANIAYTWSYWKNTSSWTKSSKVSVTSESSKHAVKNKSGVNGTVKAAHRLTVKVWVPGAVSSDGGYSLVYVASHGWDNVFAYSSLPQATSTLKKGSYQLSIGFSTSGPDSDYVTYWYTGNGKAASTSHKKAATISFAGTSNKTINFGVPTATP